MKKPNTSPPALLALAACLASTFAAAAGASSPILPPSDYKNLRLGLWEMTSESQREGGPKIDMGQVQSRMAESMKDMSPEQRARVEAMMQKQAARSAGAPSTSTHKKCMTAADRDKSSLDDFGGREAAEHCTMKEVSRTSTSIVVDISCSGTDKGQLARAAGRGDGPTAMSSTGRMTFEMRSSTEMASRLQLNTMLGDSPMKTDVKMHGRWLGADCGAVK